ncbi:MAG TPA: sucrase ferredoxin [Nocardioides sp.]|nr:sucrase ferredoxin [Nocardioides sp.]
MTAGAGTACSSGALEAGEQLVGSAPAARAWVALEQDGPWGAKAFTASHLDPGLGRDLEAAAAAVDVRPSLIRRPGRHADPPARADAPRHVLVAHTDPADTWLLEGTLERPELLRDLDWAALEAGDQAGVRRSLPPLAPSQRHHLLVCTNGRRDVCCAVRGRPVALGLAARRPDVVWEVTHTSGHRFAPTAVLLPAGTLHGWLDVDAAGRLLDAAERGDTVLEGSRGRSTWSGPGQVAELAVRAAVAEAGLDALRVIEVSVTGDHAWTARVEHRDGRGWDVAITSTADGTTRPESCGKDAVPLRRWTWTPPSLVEPLR